MERSNQLRIMVLLVILLYKQYKAREFSIIQNFSRFSSFVLIVDIELFVALLLCWWLLLLLQGTEINILEAEASAETEDVVIGMDSTDSEMGLPESGACCRICQVHAYTQVNGLSQIRHLYRIPVCEFIWRLT